MQARESPSGCIRFRRAGRKDAPEVRDVLGHLLFFGVFRFQGSLDLLAVLFDGQGESAFSCSRRCWVRKISCSRVRTGSAVVRTESR